MYKVWSNPLKDVDSRVLTRMLRKEGRKDGRREGRTEGGKEGRKDGSVTISLWSFVGEGIKISNANPLKTAGELMYFGRVTVLTLSDLSC
jgi:hypothetical protein